MERTPRRLKRRREFLHVARAGRKWAAPGLVLQVAERPAAVATGGDEVDAREEVRVGFTVTRKVGGAVARNRARRRLRAAAETVMPRHAAGGRDYVVVGRTGTLSRPFRALVGDLETALHRLGAWRDAARCAGVTGVEERDRE